MLRRLGIALAMLVGVLLLAALGAFGYAQTEHRSDAARRAGAHAS